MAVSSGDGFTTRNLLICDGFFVTDSKNVTNCTLSLTIHTPAPWISSPKPKTCLHI